MLNSSCEIIFAVYLWVEFRLQFRKRFKPKQAESVIHEVLQEKLKGKVYAVDQVTALTKELSEAVKAQLLKELDIPRYKVIVQVLCRESTAPSAKSSRSTALAVACLSRSRVS
jgi:hypothetical protein